jgi:hypothetical protein
MVGKTGVRHATVMLRAQFFLEILILNFEPFKLNYFV